jgi:hypothetical protein
METERLQRRSFTKERAPLIAAFLLFILSGPYFFGFIYTSNILKILVGVVFALICYSNREIRRKDFGLVFFYCFVVAYNIGLSLFLHMININGVINNATVFLFVFLFFTKETFYKRTFQIFVLIYASIMAISLTVWILAIMGLVSPIDQYVSSNGFVVYNHYPFLLMPTGVDSLRFNGLFDEPGVVGTLSGFILIINGFNIKDWKSIMAMISGLASFSLFFYVIAGIYFIYYSFFVKKSFVLALFVVIALGGFYLTTKDSPMMYEMIWSRVEWDEENGKFVGDNRITKEGDEYYESIKGTSEYYFGVKDRERFWSYAEGSSSYKTVVAQSGMVFLVLYLGFLLLYAWKKKSTTSLFIWFCIVLFANTYQRPDVFGVVVMFLYSVLARAKSIGYTSRVDNYVQ